ncbi:MAG: Sua5/YciO/YrdC/YwlC family protein, partial [Rhodanobacteraceae bacterium]
MDGPVPSAGIRGEAIRVRGLVQGVGFRPTVWRLARECALSGDVRNDAEGVLIHAWGTDADRGRFTRRLRAEAPPLSRIDALESAPMAGRAEPAEFRIAPSGSGHVHTGIVPDAATCEPCMREVLDPGDRRHRYAFTNCTHCGPRLSIVRRIPYDRAHTSMSAFPMCERCRAEYEDPADRRFHAQPNACPVCGPRLWLETAGTWDRGPGTGESQHVANPGADPVEATQGLLRDGEIVAIKGLGGFHLAVDATNAEAVDRLRQRKHRPDKPLALMARDIAMIRRYCRVSAHEADLLQGSAAPIVLLEASGLEALAPGVAPGQRQFGFMLPYTPLHHLLMAELDAPIVLTSGNRSEEPQCIANDEARERLGEIADALLLHDREIVNRLDDSVVRMAA